MTARPHTGNRGAIRVFVAVGISEAAREQLSGAAERIREKIPHGIQWANPQGMHLTLKFLGNIPAANVAPLLESLTPVAAETRPFTLQLAGLGMFPNRRQPRVLWAGIGGDTPALSRLQQAAEKAITALGYPPEPRPFAPHITLGRPRRTLSPAQLSQTGQAVSALTPPQPVTWQVTSIDIMQSNLHPSGARYTILASATLAPKQTPSP